MSSTNNDTNNLQSMNWTETEIGITAKLHVEYTDAKLKKIKRWMVDLDYTTNSIRLVSSEVMYRVIESICEKDSEQKKAGQKGTLTKKEREQWTIAKAVLSDLAKIYSNEVIKETRKSIDQNQKSQLIIPEGADE